MGPTTKFFVWQLNSVFVFKSKHCTSDTQIQHFENIFLMFSFLLFCTQVYYLIKKIFSLSHPTLLTAQISPSPNVALVGLRDGHPALRWTSRLHRSEADLSLAQRGSRWSSQWTSRLHRFEADLSLAQRGSRWSSRWTSGLHRYEADLSLAQRGSRKDRALSLSLSLSLSLAVEFCWFVVAGGSVLLNFWWGFVGLWLLVVGLLLIL